MLGVMADAVRGKRELDARWCRDAGDYVRALDVSPEGRHCAVGTGAGAVLVIDTATGEVSWDRHAHPGGVLELACSPAGKMVASCAEDERARIFSLESGELLAELPGGGGWVEHLSWAPDGQKLATASGKCVNVWSAAGELLLTTEPLPSTVTAIAWGRRGSELAASCYGGVHIQSLSAGAKARHLGWQGSLIGMAWSPDRKVIACGSQDCSVHFWRLPSGKDSEMSGYRLKPRALSWNPESTLLATSGDAGITVWDFTGKGPEGTAPIQLEAHLAECTHLAFSPRGGLLASGSKDASVLLWKPRRGRELTQYAFLEDAVGALAWHPDHNQPDRGGLVAGDASGNVVSFRMAEQARVR
jgi:WD40 repeat protein